MLNEDTLRKILEENECFAYTNKLSSNNNFFGLISKVFFTTFRYKRLRKTLKEKLPITSTILERF